MLSPAQVAIVDIRMTDELGRFPEVLPALSDKLANQARRAATLHAISHLTGVDRRLLAVLWHMAERWGRVTPSGVIVPLPMSHSVLAQLVGARRPTVSTALSKLRRDDVVARVADGTWLLKGPPPGRPHGDAVRFVRRRKWGGGRDGFADSTRNGQATA